MGLAGKDILVGGGRHPGVRNILLDGGTRRIGVVVHVRGNDKVGGGIPCRVPKVDHWEEGGDNHIWGVGDT